MGWVTSLLLVVVTVLGGCAGNSARIKESTTSIRSDVFEELANSGTVPLGSSELRISASLKSHKPGMYAASDIHGTADYKLLVNIDGQALLLQGNLQEENREAMKLVDPEAGDGIRYRFSKGLRLQAGTHRIVLAFPDDEIGAEREIILSSGDVSRLVLEPVYGTAEARKRPGSYGVTSFAKGLSGVRLILNGKVI